MNRYFIEVMYNGTYFHGSQIQGTQCTVQYELNKALETVLRRPVTTLGASRTDEGVHALCNFYHFDLDEPMNAGLQYSLNALLPSSMSVKNIYRATDPAANARFEALDRHYRYHIHFSKDPFRHERSLLYPFKLDKAVLQQTAAMLMEYTDFETFSKRNTQSKTFKCTLFRSEWVESAGGLQYVVSGNRFLRGMVRGLVGTQLRVARGKHSLQQFRDIIEAKDCSAADFSVPGFGLYLEQISYPEGLLVPVSI